MSCAGMSVRVRPLNGGNGMWRSRQITRTYRFSPPRTRIRMSTNARADRRAQIPHARQFPRRRSGANRAACARRSPPFGPKRSRDSRNTASANARLPITAPWLKYLTRRDNIRAIENSVASTSWHGAVSSLSWNRLLRNLQAIANGFPLFFPRMSNGL